MQLREWQLKLLPKLRRLTYCPASVSSITILAYFFWNDDRIETEFDAMECSFLCAYRVLGLQPSVLVVNRTTHRIDSFCKQYGIELQVEPNLNDGLRSLNMDCICNLHSRFKTEHVLIIQTDGILLNSGIERFLKYDYVGAPWPKDKMTVTKLPYPLFGVGNGGLSLRSKRICVLASCLYRRFLRILPYGWYFCEDVYYSYLVRLFAPFFFKRMRFPTIEDASRFSVEWLSLCMPGEKSMGFHAEIGFANYRKACHDIDTP